MMYQNDCGPLHFIVAQLFDRFGVECLDNYWMDYYEILHRYSWSPQDEL